MTCRAVHLPLAASTNVALSVKVIDSTSAGAADGSWASKALMLMPERNVRAKGNLHTSLFCNQKSLGAGC